MNPLLATIRPLAGSKEAVGHVIQTLLTQNRVRTQEELQHLLKDPRPLIFFAAPSKAPGTLTCFLLNRSHLDALKFCMELVTGFLVPSKKLAISSFFAADFHFDEISDNLYTAVELIVNIETEADLEAIEQQKIILESQLQLGLSSSYHAIRIFEIKDLLQDKRTLLIYERMETLVRRGRFDKHLIAEMQQFLVMTTEAFRLKRTLLHLNRLICLIYLFKRSLEASHIKDPLERQCFVKVMRCQIKSEDKQIPVIGVLVALNLIASQEIFEGGDLHKAVDSLLPGLRFKRASLLPVFTGQSDRKVLYAEFVKPDEKPFAKDELSKLRKGIYEAILNQVEEFLHPIFMPHNEEETIRNMLTLSKQLRFVKDIPQVIITFNEHTGRELSFTVILVRLLKTEALSIEKLFEGSSLEFVKERIKSVGFVRKKHLKEANVFHLRLKKKSFIRQDRSLDLYKARQSVLDEIVACVGPVRDYNGGMLAKQREAFAHIKILLGTLAVEKEFLLENFFYMITPVIMKNLLDHNTIKNWFLFFVTSLEEASIEKLYEKEEGGVLLITVKSPKKERMASLYN
ncbi:MAG: hypothetical protein WCN87_01515, partial [Chlamydiota bacterium]